MVYHESSLTKLHSGSWDTNASWKNDGRISHVRSLDAEAVLFTKLIRYPRQLNHFAKLRPLDSFRHQCLQDRSSPRALHNRFTASYVTSIDSVPLSRLCLEMNHPITQCPVTFPWLLSTLIDTNKTSVCSLQKTQDDSYQINTVDHHWQDTDQQWRCHNG